MPGPGRVAQHAQRREHVHDGRAGQRLDRQPDRRGQDAAHDQRADQPLDGGSVPHHVHDHHEQPHRHQVLQERAHGRAVGRSVGRANHQRHHRRHQVRHQQPAGQRQLQASRWQDVAQQPAQHDHEAQRIDERQRDADSEGNHRERQQRANRDQPEQGGLHAAGDRPGGHQPGRDGQRPDRRPERHRRPDAPARQQRQRHPHARRAPGDAVRPPDHRS